MASIALGALGSAVAGPLGGMIGGQAGSMLDNALLNHKHIRKPSLGDLIVEASTMGLPIPVVYGRNKIAGNLIQSALLSAEKHSGKGGLLSGSKNTAYYTYNWTGAVGICRGPIRNIWRIFADSKLIWDMDPEVTGPGTTHPNTPFVQSGFAPNAQGTGGIATLYHYGTGKNSNNQTAGSTAEFYFGTEDQDFNGALATLAELASGIPNSQPAYRGLAYVFFVGFPLQDYGNRIPNFSFEVNGYYAGATNIITEPPPPAPAVSSIVDVYYDVVNQVIYTCEHGSDYFQIYNALNVALLQEWDSSNGGLHSDPIVLPILNQSPAFGPDDVGGFNAFQGGPDGTAWFTFYGNTVAGPQGMILNISPSQNTVVGAYPITSNPIDTAPEVSPFVWEATQTAAVQANFNFPGGGSADTPEPWQDTGQCAVLTSANTLFVTGGLFNHWQAYAMAGGAPVLSYFGQFPPGSIGGGPYNLSWADSRQELIVVNQTNDLWIFDFSGGAPVITGPINLGDAPFSFANDGTNYYPLWDAVADCFIFNDGNNIYSVVDPAQMVAPQASLNYVATWGFNAESVQSWHMQQLPQGTFAVIVQGSGVYGGIANGSFNTITGGPGPGPGASSGDGVSGGGTGGGNVYILNSQTLVEQGSGLQTDGWTWTLATYYTGAEALCAIYNPWGNGFMDYPAGSDGWAIYRPDGFPITLAEIVQDICEECGLTVDQINVEALAKTIVYGYMISQEASGRAAIEPLQEIYQFDLIEIDGVLTATLRLTETANVNITIEEGDLGARSATAEIGANPQPKVVETRKQDVEIPQYVFLRYRTALGDFYVKNFSFEIATQYAKRAISPISTVYGQAHQSLSSTIVLDDSQAAAAVLNILLLQYINRASFTFSLPIKYIAITAGDVIELSWHDTEGNLVQYPVYIQQVDIGADNTLKCSGVSTLGATYTASTGSGGTISYGGPFALTTWVNPGTGLPSSPGSDTPSNPEVPGQPVTFPGVITMTTGQPTTVDIAETPPLSDSDDTPGFYWGACGSGTSPGWGATFVYSVDGGATYAIIGQEPAPATLGYAVTVLGDLGGYDNDLPIPGLWDVTNTLTINTIGGAAGALASVIPVNVLSQQNIFLVGKEIIGAAKITQNTNGSYTLSCLQRGLLGTDIYMASHSVGEKVVYLVADSTIQDYTTPLGFIGSDYDYAGITSGSDISTSSVFQYQIQGTRIRPEAGVHGTIVRDGSNNATITWNPRNRINYQWIDGQEQGTDEAIEAYSVDILSAGGTVLATLTDWEVGTMTIGGTIGADAGVRMVSLPAATQEAIGLVGLGAEWNPSDDHAMTLASANLLATNSGAGNAGVRAISGLTAGKFYIEGMPNSLINNGTGWGIADSVFSLSSGTDINGDTHSVGGNAIGGYLHNGVWSAIAVDLNTGLLWIRGTPTSFWNGSSSADPVAEIGGFPLSSLSGSLRYLVFKSLGGPESLLLNVGGSPFAGAVPSGYAYGWSGPGPAPITAVIYQVSSRVGRGFPYTVSA